MKISKKDLIIFFDYIDDIKEQKQIYNYLKNDFNIHIFDWSNLYEYKDNINLEIIEEKILNYWNNLKFNKENSFLITKGISAIYILKNKLNLQVNKTILINPYFAKSIINPYLYKVPSYKLNKDHFFKKIAKENYNYSLLYKDENDSLFLKKFNEYKNNFCFFEKITNYLNDYIYLNPIKKSEKNYDLSNSFIFLGLNNKVVDSSKTLKSLTTKNVVKFLNSAHNIEIDESNKFKDELLKIIN